MNTKNGDEPRVDLEQENTGEEARKKPPITGDEGWKGGVRIRREGEVVTSRNDANRQPLQVCDGEAA